jgi:hypothetical protein
MGQHKQWKTRELRLASLDMQTMLSKQMAVRRLFSEECGGGAFFKGKRCFLLAEAMAPKKMQASKASTGSSYAPAPIYNLTAAVTARGPAGPAAYSMPKSA